MKTSIMIINNTTTRMREISFNNNTNTMKSNLISSKDWSKKEGNLMKDSLWYLCR